MYDVILYADDVFSLLINYPSSSLHTNLLHTCIINFSLIIAHRWRCVCVCVCYALCMYVCVCHQIVAEREKKKKKKVAASIDPESVKKLASEARSSHRTPDYCDRLVALTS